MLLNAHEVEQLLQTRGFGAKAQVGYDLTVKAIKKINGGAILKSKTLLNDYEDVPSIVMNDIWVHKLAPGTYSLTFHQGCKLPADKSGFIRQRSSVLRCGGIITSGVYDPGFEVEEMGAVLIVFQPTLIELGARVAQFIAFENTPAELYDGQWQGNKDVK